MQVGIATCDPMACSHTDVLALLLDMVILLLSLHVQHACYHALIRESLEQAAQITLTSCKQQ